MTLDRPWNTSKEDELVEVTPQHIRLRQGIAHRKFSGSAPAANKPRRSKCRVCSPHHPLPAGPGASSCVPVLPQHRWPACAPRQWHTVEDFYKGTKHANEIIPRSGFGEYFRAGHMQDGTHCLWHPSGTK